MNIVLCGMMGAGKTATAAALEELSGKKAVDTDWLIVREHGRIADIFAAHGEQYFRNLETQTVARLAEEDNLVVATGGGCVLREQNVELLKRNGKIFFLRAKEQTLVERVKGDTERPLLAGDLQKKIADLLAVRTPVYERVADFIVDTDGLSPAEVAKQILSLSKG